MAVVEVPNDAHGFLESGGSDRPPVKRDADHLVLGVGPSCADAELHAAAGKDVDLGGLAGQQHRMTEVVVEDVAA